MSEPKLQQVGGKHYAKMAIQPIEYIMANDMCYNSGSVLKYISRFRHKNGLEDLYKARTFLDFLISDVEQNPKKYGLDLDKTSKELRKNTPDKYPGATVARCTCNDTYELGSGDKCPIHNR